MKTNFKLKEYVKRGVELQSLAGKLYDELNQGWLYSDGATLLRSEFKPFYKYDPSIYQDLTGYECFVNKIQIRDYVDADFILVGVLAMSMVLTSWDKEEVLEGILSNNASDEDESLHSTVIRFHLRRTDQPYLLTNINSYDCEEILLMNSLDFNYSA